MTVSSTSGARQLPGTAAARHVSSILVFTVSYCKDDNVSCFPAVKKFRDESIRNFIFGHLNVNWLSSKCIEVKEVLLEGKIDFLALTETKLNSSFPTSQFAVENYVISRLDRPNNLGGGGILCYINSSIPNRMRADLAYNQDGIESMVIEITVKQERWFFVVLYRPPNVSINYLKSAMDYTSHKCLEQTELVFLLGGLNIDFGKDINPLTAHNSGCYLNECS